MILEICFLENLRESPLMKSIEEDNGLLADWTRRKYLQKIVPLSNITNMDITSDDLSGVIPTSDAELDKGRVKGVISADTLVLTSIKQSGIEKIFSLAYVAAPRFSRESEEVSQLNL